jgi:hypothetical protein
MAPEDGTVLIALDLETMVRDGVPWYITQGSDPVYFTKGNSGTLPLYYIYRAYDRERRSDYDYWQPEARDQNSVIWSRVQCQGACKYLSNLRSDDESRAAEDFVVQNTQTAVRAMVADFQVRTGLSQSCQDLLQKGLRLVACEDGAGYSPYLSAVVAYWSGVSWD